MWKRAAGLTAGVLALAGASVAQPPSPLAAASAALAVDAVRTLRFTASGASFTVGQNYSPIDPWPRVGIKSYRETIDYRTGAMRVEMMRELGPRMPKGGGVPFTGQLPQVQLVSGAYAWNEPVAVAPPGGRGPATPCTAPEAGGEVWAGPGGTPGPSPAPQSQPACMLALWSTPQGFIRLAQANRADVKPMQGGTEVSFVFGGKYRMVGLLDAQHQVVRVKTWVDQSIVGDMPIETNYGGYRSFGRVRFPTRIVQKQDGFPSLDLTVTSVTANPPVEIAIPANIRTAPAEPPVTVKALKLADDVFFLTGGTHNSFAVGMKDYIVLVDTPNGENRALAVIAKAKALMPGKPIRYVVAMHHHWDHLGGIRTAIDAGATIVTHQTNRAFLERAASAPHTIRPDRLSVSKKPLKLMTVGAQGSLSDGARTIRLYTMTGFDHCDDMLMVYLPKEKILAEADAYSTPPRPDMPVIAPQKVYARALYDNIARLHLDVRTIVPFHGTRTADMAEVARQAGSA